MTIPSHILLGLVIGKLTDNMSASLIVSVAIDLDHLISYIRHGVLWSPRKFFKTITDTQDPYGDQRGYLHNVLVAGFLCILSFFISHSIGITISAAYFGHLLLDALDKSDYWPLYPSKIVNIKGWIEYYSSQEIIFDVVLLGCLIFCSGIM